SAAEYLSFVALPLVVFHRPLDLLPQAVLPVDRDRWSPHLLGSQHASRQQQLSLTLAAELPAVLLRGARISKPFGELFVDLAGDGSRKHGEADVDRISLLSRVVDVV